MWSQATFGRAGLRLGLLVLVGCGDGGGEPQASAGQEPSAASTAALDPETARLAEQGEQLFSSNACMSCHTIGYGKLTGPDLQGVTERRSPEWVIAMITHPDSMTQYDAQAKQLLAEHNGVQMPNLNLSAEQARALHAYIQRESQKARP